MWKAYKEMLNRGLQANPYIYTLFIGVHSKKGRIVEAHCLTHLFICDYFRHWAWYTSFHVYRLQSCIYGARLCNNIVFLLFLHLVVTKSLHERERENLTKKKDRKEKTNPTHKS